MSPHLSDRCVSRCLPLFRSRRARRCWLTPPCRNIGQKTLNQRQEFFGLKCPGSSHFPGIHLSSPPCVTETLCYSSSPSVCVCVCVCGVLTAAGRVIHPQTDSEKASDAMMAAVMVLFQPFDGVIGSPVAAQTRIRAEFEKTHPAIIRQRRVKSALLFQ